MPKLAANLTMLYNEIDFLDRFDAAAKSGFKGVEYLFPYAYPKEQLAERLKRNGLVQVLHNLPAGDWAKGERGNACLPGREDEFKQGVAKAIEYATTLGCKQLNCLSGLVPAGVDTAKAHATFVSNLKYAAAELEKAGIKLLIEACNTRDMPGFFLNHSKQALAILDEVGSKNLYFQYDIYHMQRMEGELAKTLEANLPRIAHLQLADNPGRNEPGTGEINYGFLLDYIDRIGYQGWIGCEYKPKTETVAGLGWTKQYLH